jgi:pilus assembly protein FimV
LYPVVGGVGAAMLALLGLWWRKRKVEEETNTESMFASSSAGKVYGAGLAAASSVANNVSSATAESSFLSEFSPTDFTSFDIDQDEIDPISEADVYLAYGRYQQAEELIRHAINDFPDRDDCKLKLLEIFHATDNKKAFEAYAGELAESGKKENTQFWTKVSDMGKEICSGSNLFSSAAAVFDMDMDTASNVVPVSLDKSDSDSVQEKAAEQDAGNSAAAKEESFDAYFNDETESEPDFDLTSFAVNDDTDEQKNDTSIDFDLNSFAAGSPAIKESDSRLSLDKDRVLDFDVSPKNSEAKSNNADSSIDDDFQGFDFSFEDESGLNEKSDISLDNDFQFNFNLDLPSDGAQDQKNSLGVSDLTDMDELETKLDLARAYIDMGDADSAKDIVKEVLEKGSSEQQKIAQTLLVDLK